MGSNLAIHGGPPVRRDPFPSVGDISGRDLGDEEIRNLTEVIRSGRLFRYGGQFVPRLEQEFARMHGVKHAVASTSGTAALHLAVGAVNPDPGDEIITSPITDMGTVIPIVQQNAVPIFADLDPRTYTLDPASVAARVSSHTRAIIAVHLFGHPCDMEALWAIARPRGIAVIEDCAQAYLAEDNGRRVGAMGTLGCFSLQQSKHMTAGDGGITITDDDALAERLALFSDKGWPRSGDVRDYLFMGMNYRMNELTGAVACAQLGKVQSVVERRRAAAARLTASLEQVAGVEPPHVRPGCAHSYWQYPITINEQVIRATPAEFAKALGAEGIPAGVGYIGKPLYMSRALQEEAAYGSSHYPWHSADHSRYYHYQERDCPHTLEILRRIIVLPWNEKYTERDVQDIADGIAKVAEHYRV